jgi:hypothetical protein
VKLISIYIPLLFQLQVGVACAVERKVRCERGEEMTKVAKRRNAI